MSVRQCGLPLPHRANCIRRHFPGHTEREVPKGEGSPCAVAGCWRCTPPFSAPSRCCCAACSGSAPTAPMRPGRRSKAPFGWRSRPGGATSTIAMAACSRAWTAAGWPSVCRGRAAMLASTPWPKPPGRRNFTKSGTRPGPFCWTWGRTCPRWGCGATLCPGGTATPL